ncbi:hypothetical protein CIPAW_03G022800 [Carya illinoinensis]|uniref:Uncharacterized protein n=1 Tax=Carya illinoinensis TaxID=32201 RepID=A0A8T1QZE9_CARIL|nr:hypothetical protein CIPAW_03G022800 [Carya illinoinensis]
MTKTMPVISIIFNLLAYVQHMIKVQLAYFTFNIFPYCKGIKFEYRSNEIQYNINHGIKPNPIYSQEEYMSTTRS